MRSARTIAILACFAAGIAFAGQRTRIGSVETIPNDAMLPPQVISSTAPSYTNEALVQRVEGTVTVEAASDIAGNIKVLRVVKGLGHGLDENALAAVETWKFAPARRNGAAVAAITQIDIDFKLPETDVFKFGGGLTPPTISARVEPQYTEEARKAGYNGTVILEAVVKPDGTADIVRVVQGLDYGLTESAMNALKQWKFKPATRGGKSVSVALKVEVNFNLKKEVVIPGQLPKPKLLRPKSP